MTAVDLELDSLVAFDNVAAGHDGVLTNASGDLVIKPCTQAELDFYEETVAHQPDFAALMPTYMGILQLGRSQQLEETINASERQAGQSAMVLPATEEAAATDDPAQSDLVLAPPRGKALDTELAIVLENVASGFKRPNILDVKLGKRLWADDAPLTKRQKLDKVADETTSASLGFRVAGMKTWQATSYKIYDKWYGRNRTVENVNAAFEHLFDISSEQGDHESFEEIACGVVEALEEIEVALENQESRMYSASLLLVYEGDKQARREALEAAFAATKKKDSTISLPQEDDEVGEEDDEDDDVEQSMTKKIFDVRIIDFAHASWTPGQGPDENMLRGVHSVCDILRNMAGTLEGGLE